MHKEIERKFLVNEKQLPPLLEGKKIEQGYLGLDPNCTVRIRRATKASESYVKGTLTIKGKREGFSASEFEMQISSDDAKQMLDEMTTIKVTKTRYFIEHEGHTWEVDVFEGDNEGLIVAELELDSEDEKFPYPDWLAEEVTSDYRYLNVKLAQCPYKSW